MFNIRDGQHIDRGVLARRSLLILSELKIFNLKTYVKQTLMACLQPFTVLFFSVIFVCFIDAQIHSFFLEKFSRKPPADKLTNTSGDENKSNRYKQANKYAKSVARKKF